MNSVFEKKQTKKGARPFVLTMPNIEILKAIHLYRFMATQDVCRCLNYSFKSITYVREILSSLAGGGDYSTNHYLYRFALPHVSRGNTEKIFVLGSRGRKFLAEQFGLPIEDYFRPHKLKHLSYAGVLHAMGLTRFLVAAQVWAATHPDFKLSQVHTCYQLEKQPAVVEITNTGGTERLKVIPDAVLLIEKLRNAEHQHYYPLLIEWDRGMEHSKKIPAPYPLPPGIHQKRRGIQQVI